MSLINDPRNDYNQAYTVDRLGNIVGGDDIKYVNTKISTMKKLAIDVLKSGHPVWFGCDVGKVSSYLSQHTQRITRKTHIDLSK